MFDIFVMDATGHEENVQQILLMLPHARIIPYTTSYVDIVQEAASQSRTEFFWLLSSFCDYSNFDLDYIPVPWEQKQIHCWTFGNEKFGDTFLVNVAAWREQSSIQKLEDYKDMHYHVGGPPRIIGAIFDVFVMDMGNHDANISIITSQVPNAHKLEYKNSYLEIVKQAANAAGTEYFWLVSSCCDYTGFDFNYIPVPWEQEQLHCWASGTQKFGDTFLVNVAAWKKQENIEKLEQYKDINYHPVGPQRTMSPMFDVFVMDMGGHVDNIANIMRKLPQAQVMRYMTSHLEMVKRAATRCRTEFFWLLGSCCDYADFDFNFNPGPWESKQIHCWASGTQKFGDTFLVNVAGWKEQASVEKLEWYQDVNYHYIGVKRLPWPIAIANNNLTAAVLDYKFNSLYTTFYTPETTGQASYDVNLWENREIIAFNRSGHVSMCPRDVKMTLKIQMYDWPYIKYQIDPNATKKILDIVFISYDEKNAEKHWEELKAKQPDAKRVHGVSGMFNALKEAARLSSTNWFYAVFAKNQIDPKFRFDYEIDYLQQPANYVFQAYNPVLDHSYGHGAVKIFYAKWLREATEHDLDIAMSIPVVTVPVLSCVNNYNETPWSAWRTAFREAYKLAYYQEKAPSIDNEYHLHLWRASSSGLNGEFSKLGANSGYEAFASNVDPSHINDWNWLRQQFKAILPSQL